MGDRGTPRRLLKLAPSAALLLCLYLVELPLWVESPGGARSVIPLITIDEAQTYDSRGRLLLTTVNVGRVNVFYALRAWLDPSARLLSEREIIPAGRTDREYQQFSLSQMDQSKIAAVVVALEGETGYPDEHGEGVIVQQTLPGSPAHGRLFAGDLITSVDGSPLSSLEDLRGVLDEAGPGTRLRFGVRPLEGGESREVAIAPVLDDEAEGPILGIFPLPNFPFPIRIESGSIGGPSAGLMWALGVTDLLTEEDLTADRAIAGTGTVDLEGGVGPIGGVAFKVEAAEEAGAEAFLVPRENLAEARSAETDLRLVPVSNVHQAVSFLESLS